MTKGYFDRLAEARERYGDIEIVRDDSESMTYSQLLSGAGAFCDRLKSMGVREGDHVALCAYNSCSWLRAFFGIVGCGAVAVLINYALPEDDIRELSSDMDAEYFLYGSCAARSKNADFLETIQPDASRCLDIDEVSCGEGAAFLPPPLTEEQFGAPAFIIFTSGSTGKPKGGMLSQRCNIAGADAYVQALGEMEGETLCLGVPLFHMFGLSMAMAHLLYGGKLLLPRSFSGECILRFVDEARPDSLAAVMTVVTRLIEDDRFADTAAHCIRRLYTGGAPLMPIQLLRTETAFDDAVVLNCYGQTESDSCIAMTVDTDSFDVRVSTVGRPLPHRTVRIMNSSGEFCAVGTVGEIVVENDGNIFCGYYKLPRERQPIDDRGYLHTGDLGFLDEGGYIHLAGRLKDIIIKGGENILPGSIEAEINALDCIREVKVMGAPDELYGESIEACVTITKGFEVGEEEIRAELRNRLPRFRMPAHFFIFDSFPLNANGKLDSCGLKVRMLSRLNQRRVEEEIINGIPVLSISARSQKYIIGPICSGMTDLLSNLGFSRAKSEKIRLCVEEMLTERVNNAYMESGDLSIELRLWPEFMRVRFSDESCVRPFSSGIDAEEQSLSVRLILGLTDRVSFDRDSDGRARYDLDYTYDTDFDAKEFFSK